MKPLSVELYLLSNDSEILKPAMSFKGGKKGVDFVEGCLPTGIKVFSLYGGQRRRQEVGILYLGKSEYQFRHLHLFS